MPDYTGIVSCAGLTALEREDVSTFAGDTTTEKEAQQTFAGLSTLEKEAISSLASLTNLEAPALARSTFAATTYLRHEAYGTCPGLATLEKEAIGTCSALATLEAPTHALATLAGFVDLEAPPFARSTFASTADLIYHAAPPVKLEREIIDRRAMGPRSPIYRAKHTVELIAGELEISTRLGEVNVEVKQITLKTPDLNGGTAKVQLFDEIGAKVYESGDATEKTLSALISTAGLSVPLAGISTLKVVASKTQSSNEVFVVILYGT